MAEPHKRFELEVEKDHLEGRIEKEVTVLAESPPVQELRFEMYHIKLSNSLTFCGLLL